MKSMYELTASFSPMFQVADNLQDLIETLDESFEHMNLGDLIIIKKIEMSDEEIEELEEIEPLFLFD